jgi:hypothetical protein
MDSVPIAGHRSAGSRVVRGVRLAIVPRLLGALMLAAAMLAFALTRTTPPRAEGMAQVEVPAVPEQPGY